MASEETRQVSSSSAHGRRRTEGDGTAAAGEFLLGSGAATHGGRRRHVDGSGCSNEGRWLRIGGVRRIDPYSNSALQAK
jgi:hypothetical protein